MKELLYKLVLIIGIAYFVVVVIPDMHKLYFKAYVKEECLRD